MDTLPPQLLLFSLGVILLLGFLTAFAKAASIDISDTRLAALSEENEKAKRLFLMLEKEPSAVIGAMEMFGYVLAILFVVLTVFGFSGRLSEVLILAGLRETGRLVHILTLLILPVLLVFCCGTGSCVQ